MKTIHYNPSSLEVEFADAIVTLKSQLSEQLSSSKILDIEIHNQDNPRLVIFIEDKDGDKHEVVMKIIQRQDK